MAAFWKLMLVNLQPWKLPPFIAVRAFFKGKGVRCHSSQRAESYTQTHLSFFLGLYKSKSFGCQRWTAVYSQLISAMIHLCE